MIGDELFVADLDGTLLGEGARLSGFARQAVTRVLEAGVHFTVASARSVHSMRPILGDLPLRLPVVAMNGAFVSDFRTGRHEIVESIPPAGVVAVLKAAEGLALVPFVTSFDGSSDNLYIPRPANEGMEWYLRDREAARDPRLRDGYGARRWLSQQIVSLTFIDSRARLEPLEAAARRLGPDVSVVFTAHLYTSGWYWLTVHSGRARKDLAVKALRQRHRLQGARVVAFGDQANDVPLLRYADHGVAVDNADPEVKAVADEVIGSNTQDAVPRWILRRVGLG